MSLLLDNMVEIAKRAGAILNEHAARRVGFELKGEFDLVTAADKASEKFIVEQIHQHYPEHAILAEEGSGRETGSEYRWYVDPVDGTTNFAHGFPSYNVTMGVEKAGEMIAGVTYDPFKDELFVAERGAGAYRNGERMRVSQSATLNDALVATGFPSRKRELNINIHFYYQMAMVTHGVRRAGSAGLDLAYVAAGRLDAFWEFGLNPWDMAAGLLLVEEAGGRCTTMRGEGMNVRNPHILATNGRIHEETLQYFAEIFRGEFRFQMPEITPSKTV